MAADQDYLFMTSDYLNPDLVAAAQKRHFLTIPKELVGFALVNDGQMDRDTEAAKPALMRPQSSAQI